LAAAFIGIGIDCAYFRARSRSCFANLKETVLKCRVKESEGLQPMEQEQAVLVEIEGQVAIITLNRPKRRNAMNQALLAQLYDAVDRVAAESAIHAAVIIGKGRAFCSGIDLTCLATDNVLDPRGDGSDLLHVFEACKKPIIGAVNGPAVTGGFELALNCDFLIAAESASFTDTHAKLGIHPGWGMTQLLQQTVGQRMAKQISLSGQPVDAQKARAIGLVNEVVPFDHLLVRAKEIAAQICTMNYPMMMTVKSLIEYRNTVTMKGALEEEFRGFTNFSRGLRRS
jgi:enoyl-CoA hydratase